MNSSCHVDLPVIEWATRRAPVWRIYPLTRCYAAYKLLHIYALRNSWNIHPDLLHFGTSHSYHSWGMTCPVSHTPQISEDKYSYKTFICFIWLFMGLRLKAQHNFKLPKWAKCQLSKWFWTAGNDPPVLENWSSINYFSTCSFKVLTCRRWKGMKYVTLKFWALCKATTISLSQVNRELKENHYWPLSLPTYQP